MVSDLARTPFSWVLQGAYLEVDHSPPVGDYSLHRSPCTITSVIKIGPPRRAAPTCGLSTCKGEPSCSPCFAHEAGHLRNDGGDCHAPARAPALAMTMREEIKGGGVKGKDPSTSYPIPSPPSSAQRVPPKGRGVNLENKELFKSVNNVETPRRGVLRY